MTQFSSLYGTWLDRELGTDDSTILFTTARRKAAINEGMRQFAEQTECCQRRASVTLTGGTAEYDLNAAAVIPGGDFLMFSREDVEFQYTDASSNVTILTGPEDLPRRDIPWLNRYTPGWQQSTVASSVAQMPSFYYVRADGPALFLGFTPVPSTGSSASMLARVPYLADPGILTNDTSEPFTFNSSVRIDLRPYHPALVHYGAGKLELLRKDKQASQLQMNHFTEYVARYFKNLRVKGGRAFMQARSYFGKKVGSP